MIQVELFPERELVNRIRHNDRTVLGELFVRYRKLACSYVTANGGDEPDAEDMLQEAIIVLWQRVCSGQFELRAKLSTFIMGVVKNKWMSEMRKRQKIEKEARLSDVSDGEASLLDSVIEGERLERVRAALEAMNEGCRQLLMLYYFEERSFKDVAGIMGFANADVAKAKKYQCKKALERLLRAQLAEIEG